MLNATIFISLAWIFWCLAQLGFAFVFQQFMNRESHNSDPESIEGRAIILLAVRGNDPSFEACLLSLCAQTYQAYELHIVVDSKDDPACQTIAKVAADNRNQIAFHQHVLDTPLKTCGLKCSALLHGLDEIKSSYDYLVLVDSDVVVHPNWLVRLLSPFKDSAIGVVTGNQWFEPPSNAGSATLLRSIWNAGAMVPAVLYGNSWAGSLAMRSKDFQNAGLQETWRNSIVDDGPISGAAKAIGLKVHFVPELLLINKEECDSAYVTQYIRRMLTWSKLYDPTFGLTIAHASLTGSLIAGLAISTLLNLSFWNLSGLVWNVIAICCGGLASTFGYTWIRNSIAAMKRRIGDPIDPISIRRLFQIFFLTYVAQVLYSISLWKAILKSRINWRGAVYEVNSKSDCRLIHFEPYHQADSKTSII